MTYTKQDTYKLTRRLYYLIRTHPDQIIFKKLWGNVYGHCDGSEITIDYRRDIIPTLIHECLHYWHWDWSESKVKEHESKIMNSLSARQVQNIIKVLASSL